VRVIDSHVHFWRIGGPGQTWPDAQWPLLYRDFGPAELAEAACGAMELQGVVLVQSQPDDRDTDWILEIARDTPVVAAVVGWVDLSAPTAPARIAELSGKPKLRGLRPMLQAIDATDWILRRELEPALQAMIRHDLRFDALIQPRHLPAMREFARSWNPIFASSSPVSPAADVGQRLAGVAALAGFVFGRSPVGLARASAGPR
jgi:L-fuconolactonase